MTLDAIMFGGGLAPDVVPFGRIVLLAALLIAEGYLLGYVRGSRGASW